MTCDGYMIMPLVCAVRGGSYMLCAVFVLNVRFSLTLLRTCALSCSLIICRTRSLALSLSRARALSLARSPTHLLALSRALSSTRLLLVLSMQV